MNARRIASPVVFALACLIPVSALAQQATYKANKEANEIHARSLSVLETPIDLQEALRQAREIHAEAAALRTLDDPRYHDCVSWQANLLYLTGEKTRSAAMYEDAANGALANGDVHQAAIGYARAAWIAKELERPADVLRLSEKAIRLSRSPLIGPRERAEILSFFDGTATT